MASGRHRSIASRSKMFTLAIRFLRIAAFRQVLNNR